MRPRLHISSVSMFQPFREARAVTTCPVCLHSHFETLLKRDRVPVLQNVIVETVDQALSFPVGKLRICHCHHCDFVWNADFDPAAIDYDSKYNNSVQSSGVYLAHQARMAERLLSLPGELVCLEVGCGEGEFLNALNRSGRLRRAIGFDPAHKGVQPLGSNITVLPAYFDEEVAKTLPADINVGCSRHTIEHIPSPRPFIKAIADYVRQHNLPLFLETPDVSWILGNHAFEDFFYEHCSLFSPRSMAYLLAEFGLQCRVDVVYGGQYMWIEALPAPSSSAIAEELCYWETKVQSLKPEGPVAIWGGASKGVTFSLLIDGFDCAIDLNQAKQGCFMPVSGMPIVSPETAIARGVQSIIVMNPNYRDEIRAQLDTMDWSGNLLVLHEHDAR